MSAYWAKLSSTLGYAWPQLGYSPIRKVLSQHVRNETATDIMDLDFFSMAYEFVFDESVSAGLWGKWETYYLGTIADPDSASYALRTMNDTSIYNGSTYLSIVISLAKVMYSTVMVDLGAVNQSTASNVLLDKPALRAFSSAVTYEVLNYSAFLPGPATADYSTLESSTGELRVTPSVISTRYICQIPQRKPVESLILSILIADLVFLQAAWSMYNWIVGAFMGEKHKPDYCEGCLKLMEASGEVKLDDFGSPELLANDLNHPRLSRATSTNSQTPFLQSAHHYRSISGSNLND